MLSPTFNVEAISARLNHVLETTPGLVELRARIAAAQHKAHEVLAHVHLPHLPTREEIGTRASGMFVKTRSLDEIVGAGPSHDPGGRRCPAGCRSRIAVPMRCIRIRRFLGLQQSFRSHSLHGAYPGGNGRGREPLSIATKVKIASVTLHLFGRRRGGGATPRRRSFIEVRPTAIRSA